MNNLTKHYYKYMKPGKILMFLRRGPNQGYSDRGDTLNINSYY